MTPKSVSSLFIYEEEDKKIINMAIGQGSETSASLPFLNPLIEVYEQKLRADR